jgi:transcriptional regulator with XRE-family HTH domain
MATSFADALKELREMKGWNKSQLAYKAHVQPSTIRMIELGERSDPRSSTLAKLSDALDVSADDILVEAGKKSPKPVGNRTDLSPKEKEIIKTIRAIQSAKLRRSTIDAVLDFTRGAQEADADLR